MATADAGMIGDVGLRSGRRSQRDEGPNPHGPAPTSRTTPGDLTSRMPTQHHRRRSRRGGDRTHRTSNPAAAAFQRAQARTQPPGTRRASESALLPPIHAGSSGPRHPSESSPTRDANVTSSPTSNVSVPPRFGDPAAQRLPVPDAAERDTPRSSRSPLNRKAATPLSKVSGNPADHPETPRLSPAASGELLRQKAERRVLKSVNDAMNDVTSVSKSPRGEGGGAGGGGGGGGASVPPPPQPSSKPPSQAAPRGKLSRRISTQSLPKLVAGEEPFSVRKKIEQFRKWHEEQYSDKLKKLRVESEADRQRGASSSLAPGKTAAGPSADTLDFAKYLERNIDRDSPISSRRVKAEKAQAAEKAKKEVAPLDLTFPTAENRKTVPASASASRRQAARCKSGATWRTWRDVNDSYAYDNVSKYIEENELLPPDRVDWIKSWLGEVEKALGLGEDVFDDDGAVVTARGHVNGEIFM